MRAFRPAKIRRDEAGSNRQQEEEAFWRYVHDTVVQGEEEEERERERVKLF